MHELIAMGCYLIVAPDDGEHSACMPVPTFYAPNTYNNINNVISSKIGH